MSYKLVIVESPAKCKKIEEYLGNEYKCIASYGHLQNLDTKKGIGCIDIQNNFNPTFSILPEKENQINKLRSAISKASEVILATDDDREGEAIAWHICSLFGLSLNTKRMIFHEITRTALLNAVNNIGTINLNLVNAQRARQVLDLLVGYSISPILWDKISKRLSAGRCQSPALRIVYDNQCEIDKSTGKKVYNTTGYFTKLNLPFQLNYNHDSEKSIEEFLEESVNHDHIFNLTKPKITTKNPPSPFTTSGLQQTASSVFSISPKETMRICQKLYEGGHITYMRTDSKIYSKEFIDKIKPYISEQYGEDYLNKNIDSLSENKPKKSKKEKKVEAQEAHEAIRPTKIDVKELNDSKMENKERKIYALIWRTTVESCMEAAKYNSITASITAPNELLYKHTEELVIFPGWKIVGGYEKENGNYSYLLTIKNGIIVDYKKITSKVTMKELKSHHTEAKLVQILEEKGIGRPSTFASLIDKIQERGYVKKENVKGKKINCIDFELIDDTIEEKVDEKEFGNEKNKLVIQDTGIKVIEFLIKYFESLFNYDYTKNMEDQLDVIAKGDKIWYTLCGECYAEIDSLKKNTIDVPKIERQKVVYNSIGTYKNEEMYLKKGKFGYYLSWGDNKKSISSTDFDESNFTIEDAISIIEKKDANFIRKIDDNSSVRNGKYGPYIFYKTSVMKKPKFIKLKTFKDNYENCDLKILMEYVENNK